jgi:hypothetical protein
MYDTLVFFCHWLQNTPMALAIGRTTFWFPLVQLVHFGGLFLWVGTNALVDLRLMGVGGKPQTAAGLSDGLLVLNWVGFGVASVGGFLLFSAAAATYISNNAFRAKLGILVPLGLALHVFIQQKARAWGERTTFPAAARVAGGIELILWMSAIVAALAIPFV